MWKYIKNKLLEFNGLASLGAGNFTVTAIGAIFWLYLASLIGQEQYGEVSFLIAIGSVAGTVAILGAGTTVIVSTAKDEKLNATINLVVVCSGIITSIVIFVFFSSIGTSLYALGYVVFGLATSELLGKKLYKKYSKFLITQRILMVFLAITLYFVLGVEGVILGISISFFPFLYIVIQSFRESKIDFTRLKLKKSFMANNYILDLSRISAGQTDKLIIAPLLGFVALGNYHLGIQILSILILIPAIVFQYSLPQDASGNRHKKLKKITVFVSVIFAIIAVFSAPVILPIFFPEFIDAIQLVQIISISVIPGTIVLMYMSEFLGEEKSKIIIIGSGIFLSVLLTGIFTLSEFFGINGIALSHILANTAEAVYLICVRRFLSKNNSNISKD